ncbi:hypothetical protein [Absidia glauca]|uniref:Retrotransposon gag domain-containing protein n=1 Tax=Absidia glauca TaxID=4829 RepID=A0A168NKG4_ABSGL|nr:hypothetical protein [Absidia glauca]
MTQQQATSSDFAQYLAIQHAKSVEVPKYQLQDSLRIWFTTYEQQANIQGVHDLNLCGKYVGSFMPPTISAWIRTLPPTVVGNWLHLKEAMLNFFGKSKEEEDRQLLSTLRAMKQQPDESISLYAAKWIYQHSLLNVHYSQEMQIDLFVESLARQDLQLTLFSLVEMAHLETLNQVIQKALKLEEKTKMRSLAPQAVKDRTGDDPMDIDYVSTSSKKGRSQQSRHHQQRSNSNNTNQRRAYDKHGNPICDLCDEKHRTINCSRYRRPKSRRHTNHHRQAQVNMAETDTNEAPRADIVVDSFQTSSVNELSLDISHLEQHQHHRLPSSALKYGSMTISVLWDSGSAITAINDVTATHLNLPINKDESIPYRDVNSNIKSTLGTAPLNIFGTTVTAHVIKGLAKSLIIGWNTMASWKVSLDAVNNQAVANIGGSVLRIPLDSTSPLTVGHIDHHDHDIKAIIDQYQDVIASNPKKPSVTSLTIPPQTPGGNGSAVATNGI